MQLELACSTSNRVHARAGTGVHLVQVPNESCDFAEDGLDA